MDRDQPAAAGPAPATFAVGRGRPLALLPGLSLSHEPPRGPARALESLLAAPLARHHRVHWIGRHTGIPDGLAIADLAAAVAEHMRDRFAGPVPVVGFSTGGFVALQLAIDHPHLVESLVVVGAGARLSEAARTEEQRLRDALVMGRMDEAWRELADDALGTRAARVLRPLVDVVAPRVSPQDARDVAAVCGADLAFDATADLGRIGAPTLLVVGLRDTACDPALALATRAGIPGAQALLLPGTRHLGAMLHPLAVRRMRDFLAAHAAG